MGEKNAFLQPDLNPVEHLRCPPAAPQRQIRECLLEELSCIPAEVETKPGHSEAVLEAHDGPIPWIHTYTHTSCS